MVGSDSEIQNDATQRADDHGTQHGGPARVDDVVGVLVPHCQRHPQRQQQEEHTNDGGCQPVMLTCNQQT